MRKQLIALVTALAVLAALGTAAASAEAAPPLEADPCLTQSAQETRELGHDTPRVVTWTYRTYLDRPCPMFIVDVRVPANSSGGLGWTTEFSLNARTFIGDLQDVYDDDRCLAWRDTTRVYRKPPGSSSFAYLGEVVFRGVGDHDERTCRLFPVRDSYDPWPSVFRPPVAGEATYRVVTDGGLLTKSGYPSPGILGRQVSAYHLPAFG